MNNMKIAIIVGLFPPNKPGGTEIAAYNLAKHLAKKGHEIYVITSYDERYYLPPGFPHIYKENGFYVHRISWSKIRVIGVISFLLKFFLKIHTIKPDIVQVLDLNMGIAAWLPRKILKIPYVVWGRGDDVYQQSRFSRIITKPILKNADAILALTENMRINLKNIYPTEIYVIPNGIDLEKYNGETIFPDRKSGTKNILFVGRLRLVKGVQYLITAMKKIHEEIPDAQLILVGDGEERERLAELSIQLGIQKYVQFIGIVPQEVVKTFMQHADVFVLPSLSEGFPNVILEAMACGLPVIASRVGGIPDIITNDTNGYLVEVKDTNDMAKKILLLLSDDTLRKKISDNNRDLVKKYAWENITIELEKIYELSIS
jgi:glycosyltransferase involved in cell wall biosynthesis